MVVSSTWTVLRCIIPHRRTQSIQLEEEPLYTSEWFLRRIYTTRHDNSITKLQTTLTSDLFPFIAPPLLNCSNMEEHQHHLPSFRKLVKTDNRLPTYSAATRSPSMPRQSFSRVHKPEGSSSARPLHPRSFANPSSDGIYALLRSPSAPPLEKMLPSISELFEISRIDIPGHSMRLDKETRCHTPTTDKSSVSKSALLARKGLGFPCDRCGRVFARKADALKHIRVVHDKLKTFSCVVCGKRFARKDYCVVSETLPDHTSAPNNFIFMF